MVCYAPVTADSDDERQDIRQSRLRRWTRAEVYHLLELGLLDRQPLELIDGLLVTKFRPMTPRHAATTGIVRKALEAVLPSSVSVWPVCPLAIDDGSEPEPDVLVVVGSLDDFNDDHPHPLDTCLLVEIADATLEFDRGIKARLYAQAGIADYWIVNLVNRQLEVYRDPTPEGAYQSILILGPAKSVAPLHAPDALIPVADLLPPLKLGEN